MSSLTTGVAPGIRGQSSNQFQIHEDGDGVQSKSPSTAHPSTVRLASQYLQSSADRRGQSTKHGMNPNDGTVPLTSSKLGNLQARTGDRVGDRAVSGYKVCLPRRARRWSC